MAALGKISLLLPKLAAGIVAGAFVLASPPVGAQQNAAPTAPKAKPSKNAPTEKTKAKPPAPADVKTKEQKTPSPVTPKSSEPSAPPPPAAVPSPLPPLPPLDTSTPPPMLPRASRDRMRSCAEEWDKVKHTRKSALPMWREFATDCLTR